MITETQKLLDRLSERLDHASDNQISKLLGISRAAVSFWRIGRGSFSDKVALRVAELLNENPAYILAIAAAERSDNNNAKKIYREMAGKFKGAAAVMAITAFIGMPEKQASAHTQRDAAHTSDLYIMRSMTAIIYLTYH